MFMCRVVGSVVSLAKHPAYEGYKLLIVRRTDSEGELIAGTLVAVDAVDAGVGDWVLVTCGGGSAEDVLGFTELVPIREVVSGVIDCVKTGSK